MRLSTAKIQNATAQKKTVRLFDGRGLYLEIAPTGGRWWLGGNAPRRSDEISRSAPPVATA